MAVNLSKGGRVSLSKEAPGLSKILVGLGWDTNSSDTGAEFDLDASAFLLGASGKVENEKNFVFYNNLTSADGSVVHTGDNRTGEGEGDDEAIKIDLSKISPNVKEIDIVVTIHEAAARRQNFGMVRNSCLCESSMKEAAKRSPDTIWRRIFRLKPPCRSVKFISKITSGALRLTEAALKKD